MLHWFVSQAKEQAIKNNGGEPMEEKCLNVVTNSAIGN